MAAAQPGRPQQTMVCPTETGLESAVLYPAVSRIVVADCQVVSLDRPVRQTDLIRHKVPGIEAGFEGLAQGEYLQPSVVFLEPVIDAAIGHDRQDVVPAFVSEGIEEVGRG